MGWENFTAGGQTYDLRHLDEKIIHVEAGGTKHSILVQFTDHCFTEDAKPGDTRPVFSPGTRKDGRFSEQRYHASKQIWTCLERAVNGKVWLGEGDRNLVVKLNVGPNSHYIIVFTLEKLKGDERARFRMRVRTAFIRSADKTAATYGEVRFKNLIVLTQQGKRPPRIYDSKRKTP
ncbi:hypothetical protein RPMA_06290 [Tardiphaga alba]|uniref:Uncharacterized protein n=1 Tax=Tardiphaga alba TaxID=340268 RepID=A0ABX8A486_9BRAD|nr:hypothetical protein [Tardiphaga alba]QUS38483.1 hypothetical protein RPMA_06290 [Tardiphaga alba]